MCFNLEEENIQVDEYEPSTSAVQLDDEHSAVDTCVSVLLESSQLWR